MSDSILYLAIVAIWAGFLIPAWVRRPHAAKTDDDGDLTDYEADYEAEAEPAEPPPVESTATAYSYSPTSPTSSAWEESEAEAPVNVHNGNSEYRDDVHTHNYGHPDAHAASSGARTAGSQPAPVPDGPVPGGPVPDGLSRGGSVPDGPAQRGPSQSREQMMRARRRMLSILAGLVFITGLFVMTGLVQWWICLPPIAMLVLYVLLLREIAMADAELAAKKRAWEARQAAKARAEASAGADVGAGVGTEAGAGAGQSAWKRSHLVWEAEQPSAEIIDISSRVGDQLYDQYADAAVRAVGD